MDIRTEGFTDRADRPLTRADVEILLQKAGSSDKLFLRGRNLANIDLKGVNLSGADLRVADLSRADLSEANLSGANLSGADLSRANLVLADLSVANLREADLVLADLRVADLRGANLRGANLSSANLSSANLSSANLSSANLSRANLSEADLSEADLSEADLSEAKLNLTFILLGNEKFLLQPLSHEDIQEKAEDILSLHIRIMEDPPAAQTIASILATLTDLHTRCQLIAHQRFADVVSYSQTREKRFVEEYPLVIKNMTYHSPPEFKFAVNADISPQGLAEAVKTAIDAMTQAPQRKQALALENRLKELDANKLELETQATHADREQARQIEAQRAELERQKTHLDIERQQIEIEKQQVALQKERLELEKQRLNYALEEASKMVDRLQPGTDATTKAMLMQTLLPSLLQLGEAKSLQLVLPPPAAQPDANKP